MRSWRDWSWADGNFWDSGVQPLHAVAALEPKPDSDWLQLTFRFVDRDPQKLDYLSRLIARGTAQKHLSPGA